MAENKKIDPKHLRPPKDVQAACRKGLKWVEEGFAGDGLQPWTIREARSIAAGTMQTINKIKRMRAWTARHEVDLSSKRAKESSDPTPGEVAWALWGGHPGKRWSNSVMAMVEKKED